MELSRLSRAIAARWVTVSLITLLGLIGALAFTMIVNQNETTLWEAQAALRVQPLEGEEVAALAQRLDEAESIARLAADDLLKDDPSSQVVQDLRNGRLLFVAQGETPEDADEKARALLQAYLDVDPTIGGAVDDLLADLAEEAVGIQAQLDVLRARAGEAPQDAETVFILAQIDAVQARLVEIVVEEAGALTLETRNALIAERAALEQRLATLSTSLQSLDMSGEELTVEETLLLVTLEGRMELLQNEYQRLYLRKLGVTDDVIEPVVLTDLTPDPQNPVANGAIGLIGGFLIAVTALVFITRGKQIVWIPEDVGGNILAEVPLRKVSPNTAEAWYDTAEAGPRKTAIQALRSAVEASVPSSGSTIALTGLHVASEDVQALAADLGGSLAISGSSVLLVDANFASSRALGEYKVGGTALATVLGLDPNAPEFGAAIEHAAESAYLVRSGLAVIPSGPPPASPADALAGRQFRALVAAAQRRYDYVFVVVDDAGSPSAQVALQRLKHGILVMAPGATTVPEVNAVNADLQRLNIEMLGSVFLGRHERRVAPPITPKGSRQEEDQTSGEPPAKPSQSPISRLETYAIPDERRTSVVPHNSLGDLASQLGAGDPTAAGMARRLLITLNQDPAGSYEAVAQYIVTRTTDMMTAKFGYGDVSEELIEAVDEHGFLSLRPLRSHRTVATWLRHEIETEVDDRTASELIEGIERVATDRVVDESTLDGWLSREYFRRHLQATGDEPDVLHLSSPEGTVGVLVPTLRLDVDLMIHIIEEVASAATDELERFRAAATTRGDLEQAAVYDRKIYDVDQFEQALRRIVFTESGRKRRRDSNQAWAPDWGLGKRANLGPLQAAGLFPFEVLTQEEMDLQQAGV